MKKIFGVVAITAMTLVGCGKNICDEYVDAADGAQTKAKACAEAGETYTKPTAAMINQCNEATETSCTDSDKKALESAVDCIDGLPTCTAATKDDFERKTLACFVGLIGVSEGCLNALGSLGPS